MQRFVCHVGVRRSSAEEFAKFAIAGALGFATDYAILVALVRIFDVDPLLARPFSVAVAIGLTWALNRGWTFKRPGSSAVTATLPAYYLVQSLGGLINYATFTAALLVIPGLHQFLILPTAAGSIAAMVFNFILCRRLFALAGRTNGD